MKQITIFALWASGALVVVGCGGSDEGGEVVPTPSVTDTGTYPNLVLHVAAEGTVGSSLLLDASASTPASAQCQWTVLEAPEGSHELSDAEAFVARFVPAAPGSYTFQVELGSGEGSDVATARVEVGCATPPELAAPKAGARLVVSNRVSGSCADYRLSADLVLPSGSTLEIESAVVIEVVSDVAISGNRAGLRLLGDTTSGSVELRGVDASAGSWRGIHLEDAPEVVLRRARVLHTGAGEAGLRLSGASSVDMSFVSFLESSGRGIYLGSGTKVLGYESTTYGRSLETAARIPLSLLPDISTLADTHLGSAPYELVGDFLARPAVISGEVPHYFSGAVGSTRVRVFGDLEVQPGAALWVGAGLGLEFAFAQFNLAGTAEAPISLAGAGGGEWRGLWVSTGADVRIEHATLGGAMGPGFVDTTADITATTSTTTGGTTRLTLSSVRLEAPSGTALWADADTELRCTSIATSGAVASGCYE